MWFRRTEARKARFAKGLPQENRRRNKFRRFLTLSLEQLEERQLLAADLGEVAGGLDATLEKIDDGVKDVLSTNLPIVGDQLVGLPSAGFVDDIWKALENELDGTESTIAQVEGDITNALGTTATVGHSGSDGDDLITFAVTVTKTLTTETVTLTTGLAAYDLEDIPQGDGQINVTLDYVFKMNFGVEDDNGTQRFFFDTSPGDEVTIGIKTDASLFVDVQLGIELLNLTGADNPEKGTRLENARFVIDVTEPSGDDRLETSEEPGFDAKFSGDAHFDVIVKTDPGAQGKLPVFRANMTYDWDFMDVATDVPETEFGDLDVFEMTVDMDLGSFFDDYVVPVLEPINRILEPIRPVVDLLTRPIPGLNDIAVARDFINSAANDNNEVVNLVDFIKILGSGKFAGFIEVFAAFDDLVRKADEASGKGETFIELGSFEFDPMDTDLRDSTIDVSLGATKVTVEEKDAVESAKKKGDDSKAFFEKKASGEFTSTVHGGSLVLDIIEDPEQAFNLFLGRDATFFTWHLPWLEVEVGGTIEIPIYGVVNIGMGGNLKFELGLTLGYDSRGLEEFADTGNVVDIFREGFFLPTTPNDPFFKAVAQLFGLASVGQGLVVEGRAGIQGEANFFLNDPGATSHPGDPDHDDNKLRLSELGSMFDAGPFCAFDIAGSVKAFVEGSVAVGFKTAWFDVSVTVFNAKWTSAPIVSFECSCAETDKTNSDNDQAAFANSLATLYPDGTLVLNIGPRAYLRTDLVPNVDGDEDVEVKHVDGVAGNETVTVKAFGYTGTFPAPDDVGAHGVVRIFGDAGVGNDRVALDGILSPSEIYGGIGEDVLDAVSEVVGPVTFEGGPDDDSITGGEVNDILRGNEGNDVINGGKGDDLIEGGAGNDELYGGLDNDQVYGGPGGDVVSGEEGDDLLNGNESDDTLLGGPGNDVLKGGDFNDTLVGGEGDDSILGGNDSDVIVWDHHDVDDGDDLIDGNDTIDGGTGADRLVVTTSNVDESFVLQAALTHLLLSRTSSDPFDLDVLTVEELVLATGDGADTIEADDLSDTDLEFLFIDVGGLDTDPVPDPPDPPPPGLGFPDTPDDKEDNVTLTGRRLADDVVITTTVGADESALVDVQGLSPAVQLAFTKGDDDRLTVRGDEGDDSIKAVSGVEENIQITLNGGEGNDYLSADAILNGGPGDDFLVGGAGDDTLNGNDGDDTAVGGAGSDTINGGAGFDVILIEGTPDNDTITASQDDGTTLQHTVNGTTETDTFSNVEEARIEAGEGDDLIGVNVDDGLVATPAASLRFTVIGDAPNASDQLFVRDDGPGDLVVLREGPDGRSGSVSVGPLAPVDYQGIESVSITPLDSTSGTTGDDDHGRLLVFKPDPFDNNDSRLVATFLGSEPTFLRDLSITPGSTILAGPFDPLPGDEDWFEFRPDKIGTFRFEALFREIDGLANGRPGLPDNGDINLSVFDSDGVFIAGSTSTSDNESVDISMAANESYFLQVDGVETAINSYDLNVVEVDVFGPTVNGVNITGIAYDLFDPKPAEDGPTPPITSLTISLEDLVVRAPGDPYPALDEAVASDRGHYLLLGDAHGIIPISDVIVTNDAPVVGQAATATIELRFSEPLPDDRFTLTIADTVLDPAGNALDGESNADEPQETPEFPSGDTVAGGDFVARFTVDSRAEVGVWSAGSVYLDINGNFVFDPENPDYANRDITFDLGFTSDYVFAGNFADGGAADGFDKLAVYGKVGGTFRWLIDTDNDGVPDLDVTDPASIIGIPFAGDFDLNAVDGDEVGLFNGTTWYLDTNHDFTVDLTLPSAQRGHPIAGDFDGDGFDDLGTLNYGLHRFEFDLTGGVAGSWNGVIDDTIELPFGEFIGVRERPIAADFDGDGIDDVGLWVPDRSGVEPEKSGEWYILISDETQQNDGTVDALNHPFTPQPFGDDIFARFGDEFAVPVVGNFDPPVAGGSGQPGDSQLAPDPADSGPNNVDPQVVNLTGTRGNDQVEITAGTTPGAWKVTVNGVPQGLGSAVTTVYFDGLGGDDTVSVTGTSGSDAVELWTDHGTLIGAGCKLSLSGVESISVEGGGGSDEAVLHGSASADEFVAWKGGATMTTGSGDHKVAGFETIQGDGEGGFDIAKLYASEGDDVFDAYPNRASLSGPGFQNIAADFEGVHGYAWGGEDVAYLHDSSGDDAFRGTPIDAVLCGGGAFNRAKHFTTVTAYATTGKDLAEFHDSPGDDFLAATPTYAALSGEGFDNRARGFDEVRAYADSGGYDWGKLFDSAGDDQFFASSRVAGMVGNGFYNYFQGFDALHAYATQGGTDVAKLFDSAGDDTYTATPIQAALYGEGFYNRVKHFDAVHAYATAGGTDTANLTGSDGDDTFLGRSQDGSLYGTGFLNRAKHFDALKVHGAGGLDRAVLHDATLERIGDSSGLDPSYAWDARLYEFEEVQDRSSGRTEVVQAADEVLRAYWLSWSGEA